MQERGGCTRIEVTLYALPQQKLDCLQIKIEGARSFQNNCVKFNSSRTKQKTNSNMQCIGSKCEEYKKYRRELAKHYLQEYPPKTKKTKKTTNLPARRRALQFLETPKNNSFPAPGEEKTDKETPTHRIFLEKEISEMGALGAALFAWRRKNNTQQEKMPQSCIQVQRFWNFYLLMTKARNFLNRNN